MYSTRGESRVISSNELIPRWEKRGGGGVGGSNFSYGRAWISARTVHYAMPFILVNRHSSLPVPRHVPSSVPRIARRDAGRPSLRVCRARLWAFASRLSPHTAGTTFAFVTILRNSCSLINFQPFPQVRLSSFLTARGVLSARVKLQHALWRTVTEESTSKRIIKFHKQN